MDVIPLTLAISLLLSLTFIALFMREFTRPRSAGAEHASLLPLEHDLPARETRSAPAKRHQHDHGHDHAHAADEVCASKRADGKCCATCQRRKDRIAAQPARPAQS